MTDLVGAPKIVNGFSCSQNTLTGLKGAPNYVNGYFYCYDNQLTSLFGVPKITKLDFYVTNNPNLLDISDIWNSDFKGPINFDINQGMAILPLIKFKLLRCDNIMITSIHRNQGSSKQNILNFQYDLIENGYAENARWKPI